MESHCDKLFRVTDPEPSLIHLESQSGSKLGIPRKMHHYNTNADMVHDLPVKSVLLLRKEAVASDMNGVYVRNDANGQEIVRFNYSIVKLWEMSYDDLIPFGPFLLALGLATKDGIENPEQVFERFRNMLSESPLGITIKRDLLGNFFTLGGLVHKREYVEGLFMGLDDLIETSSSAQLLMDRGDQRGMVRSILDLGVERLGEPSTTQLDILRAIKEIERLRRILRGTTHANSWDELLQD